MDLHSEGVLRAVECIDKNELVNLAVAMGNIQAPSGFEMNMSKFVANWLAEQGFASMLQAVTDNRHNVVAVLKGTGRGYNLLLNSHLDSAQGLPDRYIASLDDFPPSPMAWVEDNKIFGKNVQNDRGPMAATMIAAKAIKQSKIELKGDLLLTMVVGEIGMAQIDEFQGARYLGKGVGSRHLVTHGPIADYALVAETTDFGVTWVEAGALYLKVTLTGKSMYTPRSYRPERIEEHPNPIVRMTFLVQELEKWAKSYEEKYTTEYPPGKMIPKASIGAIRGGGPYKPSLSPEKCSIYIDVRIPPFLEPLEVMNEIREVVRKINFEVEIVPYLVHRGYEGKNVETLVQAIKNSHKQISGRDLPPISSAETSMWRDVNVFNQAGIPSVTFGPRRVQLAGTDDKYVDVEDLLKIAKMYALVALEICLKEKA